MITDDELGIKYYNLSRRTKHWSSDDYYALPIRERIAARTKDAMSRSDVRLRYEEGLKNRNTRSQDLDVRKKRSETMRRTLAIKFADLRANRRHAPKFGSKEYRENMKKALSDTWANRSPEEKAVIGAKISERNLGKKRRLGQTNTEEHRKKISEGLKSSDAMKSHAARISRSKWWNDGRVNRRSEECPGEDFMIGKLPHKKKSN